MKYLLIAFVSLILLAVLGLLLFTAIGPLILEGTLDNEVILITSLLILAIITLILFKSSRVRTGKDKKLLIVGILSLIMAPFGFSDLLQWKVDGMPPTIVASAWLQDVFCSIRTLKDRIICTTSHSIGREQARLLNLMFPGAPLNSTFA